MFAGCWDAMRDPYDRDVNYLRISVTDRCNLRCVYCMPKEGVSSIGHDDILRYEEMLRIASVAVRLGIAKVRVTGGEPLVRRGVVPFISSLNAIDQLRDISLTTNGILLSDYAAQLYAAGIRRINVSLDSLNPDKYARITRGGDIQQVLEGIEHVHRIGFSPIKINTVAICGLNDGEILDFARMTLEKPYQVRFIELMRVGYAQSWREGAYLPTSDILRVIRRHYQLNAINGTGDGTSGPAELYRIEGSMGEIGFISPVSQHICRSCNRLRLTADGHLRACLLSDDEVDLKTPLRGGCSDDDIEALMREAIAKKPPLHGEGHESISPRKCMRGMPSIGG